MQQTLENFRLTVFRAVAAQLSFRKAAEQLLLTQPAVSQQVKALEEELGAQLFDRTGQHIALTRAGELLLDYAQRSGGLLDEAQGQIAALGNEQAGELRLGASTTIAQYVLPQLLAEFVRLHPRVRFQMVSGNTEQIVDELIAQKVQMGFLEGPPQSRDVRTEAFQADELVLIASAAHEWAESGVIQPEALLGMPLLMRERGSGTRRVIELALQKAKLAKKQLNIVMELDSTEAIKSAVEAGLGVGFVSRWAVARDLRLGKNLRIVEVEGMRLKREFVTAFTRGPEPTGLVEEFRRFVQGRRL